MTSIKFLIITAALAVSIHAQGNRQRFNQVPGFRMPNIPKVRILTVEQIRNTIPGPGQVFNGAFAKSSSGFVRGKNGKLVRTGGTYVLTNNNGKIHEFKRFQG